MVPTEFQATADARAKQNRDRTEHGSSLRGTIELSARPIPALNAAHGIAGEPSRHDVMSPAGFRLAGFNPTSLKM